MNKPSPNPVRVKMVIPKHKNFVQTNPNFEETLSIINQEHK